MERLTDINEEPIEAWRAANGVQLGDPAAPGTNLAAGDHVLLSWFLPLVVYGPSPDAEGCFNGGYEPWGLVDYNNGGPMLFLVSDITGRAGPNGEQMPIVDEEEPDVEDEVP